MSKKILWSGPVFNPTGIATAGREMVKALVKKGYQIQTTDVWHDTYPFNKGLEFLNNAININDPELISIFWTYPQEWEAKGGRLICGFVHEGTKIFPNWTAIMNRPEIESIFVPSEAVKNLCKYNLVTKKVHVIPHGVDPEVYYPSETTNDETPFVFLSVNSWTGDKQGDRKGTELLLKAFDEEFKTDENVKLLLKVSTFWAPKFDVKSAIISILGHLNPNIMYNDDLIDEKDLGEWYRNSDCFVSPTRGEGFGLTILNALASGIPVIVTKDMNSGHMDFCKEAKSVLFIDKKGLIEGDKRFYTPGNMLANPDIESLKKQMRYAYENRKRMKELALEDSKHFRENWSWDKVTDKFIGVFDGGDKKG